MHPWLHNCFDDPSGTLSGHDLLGAKSPEVSSCMQLRSSAGMRQWNVSLMNEYEGEQSTWAGPRPWKFTTVSQNLSDQGLHHFSKTLTVDPLVSAGHLQINGGVVMSLHGVTSARTNFWVAGLTHPVLSHVYDCLLSMWDSQWASDLFDCEEWQAGRSNRQTAAF